MRGHHFSCVIFSLLLISLFLFQLACTSTSTNDSANPSQSQIATSVPTDNASGPSQVSVAPSETGTIVGEKASDNQSNTAAIIYGKPERYEYYGSININGKNREYLVHIPSSYDGTKAVPLVLVLHYRGGTPRMIADTTSFNVVSDSNGFIVVYPTGYSDTWNYDFGRGDTNVDDIGFISSLIDKLAKELNINAKMVYSTGLSAGAAMSHRLACQLSDKIAAVAIVAAPFTQAAKESCKPLRPVPVLIIHGTGDPVCVFARGGFTSTGGTRLPIRDLVNYWIGYDGCSSTPKVTELPDAEDGTKVQIEEYTANSDNIGVVFYIVGNGGHTWPGGKPLLPTESVGLTSKTFNATEIIWQFFNEHPMK